MNCGITHRPVTECSHCARVLKNARPDLDMRRTVKIVLASSVYRGTTNP